MLGGMIMHAANFYRLVLRIHDESRLASVFFSRTALPIGVCAFIRPECRVLHISIMIDQQMRVIVEGLQIHHGYCNRKFVISFRNKTRSYFK